MSDVVMPRLSDTMEEGTILRWLKRDGERVARGEELVEIETDKASMTYESDREGTLQTVASEGDTLAVGEPIARIGEGVADGSPVAAAASSAAAREPTAAAEVRAAGNSAPPQKRATTTNAGEPAPATTPNGTPPEPVEQGGGRVKASPLARRIARERGVDLAGVSGSGPGGRIVKADVEAQAGSTPVNPATPAQQPATPAQQPTTPAQQPTTPAAAGGPGPADVTAAKGESRTVELSRTQRTIARRMAESKATIPDFTLTAEVDMEACVALRAELKRLAKRSSKSGVGGTSSDRADDTDSNGIGDDTDGDGPGGDTGGDGPGGDNRESAVVPTYNDMIVKACALALREHPRANGSYRDGRFELHARVNVGVAVAVGAGDPTAGALVVPTVFDADAKALGEIARETRALAQRVRDGQVTPPELSGATFTVSNLGMYGIRQFTAIVNPPQAAILAVGEVAPRPVARKKKVVTRPTMTVTLACDHRILYGADAALFLTRVRELLEEPAALTL